MPSLSYSPTATSPRLQGHSPSSGDAESDLPPPLLLPTPQALHKARQSYNYYSPSPPPLHHQQPALSDSEDSSINSQEQAEERASAWLDLESRHDRVWSGIFDEGLLGDERAAEELRRVRARVEEVEERLFGPRIESPRELRDRLLGLAELELGDDSAQGLEVALAVELNDIVEAGFGGHDEVYDRMAEVLNRHGAWTPSRLNLFRSLPITSLTLSHASTTLLAILSSSPNSFLHLTHLTLPSLSSHLTLTLTISRLTHLSLYSSPFLGLAALARLLVPLAPSLVQLSLRDCAGVTNEAVELLRVMKKLQMLDLGGRTKVGRRGLRRIVEAIGFAELEALCPPDEVVDWLMNLPPYPSAATRSPDQEVLSMPYRLLRAQLELFAASPSPEEEQQERPSLALKIAGENVEETRHRVAEVVRARLLDERCGAVCGPEARRRVRECFSIRRA